MTSEKLRDWMREATPEEQRELAAGAGTSRSHLYQLTYPKEKGGRVASADLAARIEEAVKPITARAKGRLPALARGDINPTCGACPYYHKCRGKK